MSWRMQQCAGARLGCIRAGRRPGPEAGDRASDDHRRRRERRREPGERADRCATLSSRAAPRSSRSARPSTAATSIDISTLTRQTGLTALDHGLREHRLDAQSTITYIDGDAGHPALPRLRDRGPRRAARPTSRWRGCSSTATLPTRRRARRVRREDPSAHPAARGPQALLLGAAAHRAPDVGALERRLGAVDLLRGLARPARPRAGRARPFRLLAKLPVIAAYAHKKSTRPGVPLPRQLAELRRQLPQAQLRQHGRALRDQPGPRRRRSTGCSSCTRTTSRTRRPRRCDSSARPRPTSSRPSPPASTRSTGRCTAAPTRPCCRCSRDIRDSGEGVAEVRRAGEEQGRRRQADGLRPPGLQELRPAREARQGERRRGARRPRRERPAARHREGARADRARRRLLQGAQASTRTSTSTPASSTRRWASRPACSPCCSRSGACPAGSRTGAR